jgi:hypothetical protein
MLRLLTQKEKDLSFIPRQDNFMTVEEFNKIVAKTKSADEPVTITREIFPDNYFNEKYNLPTPPTVTPKDDGIKIEETSVENN